VEKLEWCGYPMVKGWLVFNGTFSTKRLLGVPN